MPAEGVDVAVTGQGDQDQEGGLAMGRPRG